MVRLEFDWMWSNNRKFLKGLDDGGILKLAEKLPTANPYALQILTENSILVFWQKVRLKLHVKRYNSYQLTASKNGLKSKIDNIKLLEPKIILVRPRALLFAKNEF